LNAGWGFGGQGPAPRTVVVFGNCQVPFVAQLLAAVDDWNDDYRFVIGLNHPRPGEPRAAAVPAQLLQSAVLVLWQHEERDNNPAALALRGALPAGTPVFRFPSYLMTCLWPFECPEPRDSPEPAFPYKRYPLGDLIGLEVARMGLRGPLGVAAYMDLSQQRMPDLRVRRERDFERMRRHDGHCDIPLTDFVEAHWREEHLFWIHGHVSRRAMCEVAVQLADALRPRLGGSAARARACIEAAADFEGLGDVQLPIHPLVADAYGLAWAGPDRRWRWYDQQWTFFEYIERYIDWDTSW
jgi:hypothetical protein